MKYIARYCLQLTELNISTCHQVTDVGIGYIAIACKKLRKLDITTMYTFQGDIKSVKILQDYCHLLQEVRFNSVQHADIFLESLETHDSDEYFSKHV